VSLPFLIVKLFVGKYLGTIAAGRVFFFLVDLDFTAILRGASRHGDSLCLIYFLSFSVVRFFLFFSFFFLFFPPFHFILLVRYYSVRV